MVRDPLYDGNAIAEKVCRFSKNYKTVKFYLSTHYFFHNRVPLSLEYRQISFGLDHLKSSSTGGPATAILSYKNYYLSM